MAPRRSVRAGSVSTPPTRSRNRIGLAPRQDAQQRHASVEPHRIVGVSEPKIGAAEVDVQSDRSDRHGH
eukprot:583133-Pyramimonas_sp.AAC.1